MVSTVVATSEDLEQELLNALHYRYDRAPSSAQLIISSCPQYTPENDGPITSRVFTIDDLEEIAHTYAGKRYHVWSRLSVLPPAEDLHLNPNQRGTEKQTWGTTLCHVDLDPDPEVEKWLEVTLEMLENFQPAPTRIEFSGRGLYAFWAIPWTTDWQRVKKINKGLAAVLGADHCHDVSRILRLPGTLNPKLDSQEYASIIQTTDKIYTLEELEEANLAVDLSAEEVHFQDNPLDTSVGVPFGFQEKLPRRVWERIETEAGAISAGAPLRGDRRHVDRSRNDLIIALDLLRLKFQPEEVYAVLTHPEWFSGSKFRQKYDESYVMATLERALSVLPETDLKNPVEIANLIREQEDLWYYGHVWYLYDKTSRRYRPGERDIALRIIMLAGEAWRTSIETEVFKNLERHLTLETEDLPYHPELIKVANGTLNWHTGELHPSTADEKMFSSVDAKWDPNVDTTEVDRFVAEILPEELIESWWQVCGYCLQTTIPLDYRLLLFVVGPPRTGKTSLMLTLQYFLGIENCGSTKLAALTGGGNQFTTSALVGKMLNIDHDANRVIKDVTQLKTLSNGEPIEVEPKGSQARSVQLYTKFAFVMNNWPIIHNAEAAFYDRVLVLEVSNKRKAQPFTQDNKDLKVGIHKRLMMDPKNRNAWLKRSVEGLRQVEAAQGFSQNEVVKAQRQKFIENSDPVLAFWKNRVVPVPDGVEAKPIKLLQFYQDYKFWRQEEGNSFIETFQEFTGRTKDHYEQGTLSNFDLVRKDSWYVTGVTFPTQNGRAGIRLVGQTRKASAELGATS